MIGMVLYWPKSISQKEDFTSLSSKLKTIVSSQRQMINQVGYAPQIWPLELSFLEKDGNKKVG